MIGIKYIQWFLHYYIMSFFFFVLYIWHHWCLQVGCMTWLVRMTCRFTWQECSSPYRVWYCSCSRCGTSASASCAARARPRPPLPAPPHSATPNLTGYPHSMGNFSCKILYWNIRKYAAEEFQCYRKLRGF